MEEKADNTALMEAFRGGRQEAFSEVFRLFWPSLRYFAFQIVRRNEDAEDLAEESFIKLWDRHTLFETLGNIKAFLFIATRNACLNSLKQNARNQQKEEALSHYLRQDAEEGADLRMIRTELVQLIYKEMEQLPERCRAVFELSFFEEMKNPDIAALLDISQHTVRVQKSKAVRILRSALLKNSMLSAAFLWQLDQILATYWNG